MPTGFKNFLQLEYIIGNKRTGMLFQVTIKDATKFFFKLFLGQEEFSFLLLDAESAVAS